MIQKIDNKKAIEMARSFLQRSYNKYFEARDHFDKRNYPESISATQESIELSLKAIFMLLQEKVAKRHYIKEEEFREILKKIPEKLQYLDYPKLYLYSKFWSHFYTIAKYGLEILRIGPEKLFEKEEADLGLKHAYKCRKATSYLRKYMQHPW